MHMRVSCLRDLPEKIKSLLSTFEGLSQCQDSRGIQNVKLVASYQITMWPYYNDHGLSIITTSSNMPRNTKKRRIFLSNVLSTSKTMTVTPSQPISEPQTIQRTYPPDRNRHSGEISEEMGASGAPVHAVRFEGAQNISGAGRGETR